MVVAAIARALGISEAATRALAFAAVAVAAIGGAWWAVHAIAEWGRAAERAERARETIEGGNDAARDRDELRRLPDAALDCELRIGRPC